MLSSYLHGLMKTDRVVLITGECNGRESLVNIFFHSGLNVFQHVLRKERKRLETRDKAVNGALTQLYGYSLNLMK